MSGHNGAITAEWSIPKDNAIYPVMIQSFRTDRSGQTVQTQISVHSVDVLLYGKATLFELQLICLDARRFKPHSD